MSRIDKTNLSKYTQNVKAYINTSMKSLQTEMLGGVAKNTVVATFKIEKAPTTIILNRISNNVRIDWGDGKGISKEFTDTYEYTTIGDFICTLHNVNNIEQETFKDRTELTSVAIGMGCPQIRNKAFYGCTNLTSVVIPDSVNLIGDEVFRYCDSLTSIIIPGSVTSIGQNAFRDCSNLTSVVIGDGVASIGGAAFNSTGITEIIVPASVETLGNSIFNSCASLKKVEIKGNATLSKQMFLSCTSLEHIQLPDGLTGIGVGTFGACTSLTSIVIPISVATIGSGAFNKCTNLTIYCEVEQADTPSGWATDWHGNVATSKIKWGYKHKDYPTVVTELNNITDKEYATEQFVEQKIAEAEFGGGSAIETLSIGNIIINGEDGTCSIEAPLLELKVDGGTYISLSDDSHTSIYSGNIEILGGNNVSIRGAAALELQSVGDIVLKNADKSILTIDSNGATVNGTLTAGALVSQTNCQANGFYAISDARKKENIIDYTPENSILDLPIKEFNFIGQNEKQIGCIAQDLQQLFPNLVKEDGDGYLSIQENKLVYLLLDEVRKLKAEVEKLKGV